MSDDEKVEEVAASDEKPQDGVFISKIIQEDGSVQTAVQIVGEVQVTEVQTIIEFGLKSFREAVGLGHSKG